MHCENYCILFFKAGVGQNLQNNFAPVAFKYYDSSGSDPFYEHSSLTLGSAVAHQDLVFRSA